MKINCIAIDDEPLALDKLEQYIQKIPYLNLVGRFENAIQALEVLKHTPIDLMYLDINMPDVSGVDFLKGLTHPPKVIFTTAYSQFALEGFELNVADYLLKPFSFDRFMKATERVYTLLTAHNSSTKAEDFIFVKAEHNLIKIDFSALHYIEGYKDYVKMYLLSDKPQLTIISLKALEGLLPADRFLRVHRSFIIAIDKIQAIRNGKVLIKDKWIPIGESYLEIFETSVLKGRIH